MATIGSESPPCPERCSKCKRKCFGRTGHSFIKTAGRGLATPHQCQCGMNWASAGEWIEIMRAEARETRREIKETIKSCRRCLAAVERLG